MQHKNKDIIEEYYLQQIWGVFMQANSDNEPILSYDDQYKIMRLLKEYAEELKPKS